MSQATGGVATGLDHVALATGLDHVAVATGLDHVALATGDLDACAAEWTRLGFALTPVARHRDGAGVPTGTGNVCAMLRTGYVELIAVVDPARPSATLGRFVARYAGIHIVSLAIDNEVAAQVRLGLAGFAVEIARSERDGARFARLPFSDAEPRLQLIRHFTPERVWQPQFLVHPNHADALVAVVIVDAVPAVLAARLSRVAGVAVVPDPAGGFALPLAAGTMRVLPIEALGSVFPGMAVPSLPFVAGVVIRTDDGCAAVAAMGVARPVAGGWLAEAGGAAVLFTA